MKTETEKELDSWIAEHVFEYKVERGHMEYDGSQIPWEVWVDLDGEKHNPKKYTTNPADALSVLEKCAEKCGVIKIVKLGYWWVNDNQKSCEGKADTLPLAIARFAKALYSE